MGVNVDMSDVRVKAQKKAERIQKAMKVNRERKAKGLPALYDELGYLIKKPRRKASSTRTVTAAIAAAEITNARQTMEERDISELEPPEEVPGPRVDAQDPDTARAIREAEAARMVQDMKNGRIDHSKNWNPEAEYSVEGGDRTEMFRRGEVKRIASGAEAEPDNGSEIPRSLPEMVEGEGVPSYIDRLFRDLYMRLDRSFSSIETSMSDLQGRVSELSAIAARVHREPEEGPSMTEDKDKLKSILEKKTMVDYNIGRAKLSVEAICVYHQPPCLTVVTKMDSATVSIIPGTTLTLGFEDNGIRCDDVPVSYLGTEFCAPELGLRFSGFIVDSEAGDVQVNQ